MQTVFLKTSIVLFLLMSNSFQSTSAQDTASNKMGRELSNYITLPTHLFQDETSRAVVISFVVDDLCRVQSVKVHAENKPLIEHIRNCLLNRKIRCLKGINQKEFTVKLRFEFPHS